MSYNYPDAYPPPIDFRVIRKALIEEVQKVTGLICIREETKGQTSEKDTRPALPYCSLKITTPAAKIGDDSAQNVQDDSGNPTTVVNWGGPRKMTVSFKSYAVEPEDAYSILEALQTALKMQTIRSDLRAFGIAVWDVGAVADLSALLNTGYEGRASLDAFFGLAANMTEDLGEIDSADITLTAKAGDETIEDAFHVQGG